MTLKNKIPGTHEYEIEAQFKKDKRAQKIVASYVRRKDYSGLFYFLRGYLNK
jgi:hypothetical protein